MSYTKFYLYKKQVSNDGGYTWQDVEPLVTAPSGDPIAVYDTYEECEGITPCDCSAFTPSLSITVPSTGGTVTLGTFSDDCLNGFSYSFTTPTGMITSASVSGGSGVSAYTATISSNTSSSSRSGTITVTYNAGQDSCSTSAIPISQSVGCDCDSFVFEGVEETSTASIILSLHNGGSTSLDLGTFEIFTTESSVQVPVNYQIAAGETKDVLVANYGGNEGNTVVRVEGTISNTSYCFTFICAGNYCDLIDGDTLTVEVASTISCS